MSDGEVPRTKEPTLTADVVFSRLERLRALLRLTAFLSGFRPATSLRAAAGTNDAGGRRN